MGKTVKTYTVKLAEDAETGDMYMPLPDELLDELGWKEGDVLDWQDNGDRTFSLTKIEQGPCTPTTK
jgi:phytoene/squalene synthetase